MSEEPTRQPNLPIQRPATPLPNPMLDRTGTTPPTEPTPQKQPNLPIQRPATPLPNPMLDRTGTTPPTSDSDK